MSPGDAKRLILDGVEDSNLTSVTPLKREEHHHADKAELLVVDDNEDNRTALGGRLKRLGYQHICEACNGQEALDILSRRNIDLLLLDIIMPVMDGFQVLEAINASPALRHLPVIVISANDDMESVVKCLKLGAVDYLPKPFNPLLLSVRVETSLEKKRLQEVERAFLEFHDRLTGLPNRAQFLDHVQRALYHSQRRGGLFAVVEVEVGAFRNVSEGLGIGAADELILRMAERIKGFARAGDTVARTADDRFAVLLRDIRSESNAVAITGRLLEAMGGVLDLRGKELIVDLCAGVVPSSGQYEMADTVLRDAGLALSRAKAAENTAYAMFDPQMHARVENQLALKSDLRDVLNRDELCLFYQPIISLESGTIVGFEALLRWRHPERGLVPPNDFIPIAEETGLIVPIGNWVLMEATRQVAEWCRRFANPNLSMSVNVSGRQFTGNGVVDHVRAALEVSGPVNLKLEVTETAVMGNPQEAAEVLRALKVLGTQLYIDDFGTGYSSLSYLHRFPFDVLKVDQSFVRKLTESEECRAIVHSTIAMARALGLAVVAEGVEDAQSLEFLRKLGCDFAQGYYFARPLEVSDGEALLEQAPRW